MSFAHAGLATQTGLVPNAVYAATIWGTSTPAGIYADADRDATLSSSVATDAAGNAAFYSDPGTVALRIIGGVGNEPAVPVTIPVNPLDIGGSAALSLSYNSVGPFSVPVFNVPVDFVYQEAGDAHRRGPAVAQASMWKRVQEMA